MAALYRNVLCSRFDSLHPVLQRFHSSETGGSGSGRFQVTRQPGWFRAFLARVLSLPPASADVAVTLEVIPTAHGERWLRTFGDKPLQTSQWARDGLLVESAGPIRFGFALDVVQAGMVFTRRRVWLLGVPLPRPIAPNVSATVVPDDEGWTATVTMSLPLIGNLLTYSGRIVPRWT